MSDAARGQEETRTRAIRRAERDATAFARAARHSRRVRVLKFILPVVAIVVSVLFLGYSLIPQTIRESVDIGAASIEDGHLVIENPTLDGFTRDNLPYTMTAARARQAVGPTNAPIDLSQIRATIPINADTEARISAGHGHFDRANDRLTLGGSLSLSTNSGLHARLQSAEIDLASNALSTDDPVEIELEGMRITANRFRASDSGKTLVFEDSVHMEIDPAEIRRNQDEGDGSRGDE